MVCRECTIVHSASTAHVSVTSVQAKFSFL